MRVTKIKSSLVLGAAASVIAGATPALADEETPIIVTARRVEERLQDVPISITVYNQEELTKRNVAVAADLATYTPSLSVNLHFGPEKLAFSLRGFNQEYSTAPTVGVYFADVVGVRADGNTTTGNTVGAGAFTDLQNVQVLKGPQGTLFGRNTTGGAVLLVPQKPTDKLEGYVEGTYGNFNQARLQAALNVPLSDTFKIRAAVDRNKRDGYMKNHSGIGPKDFLDTDYFYGRLSIVANPTPNLENYTIFHYSKSDTNGYAARIAICDRAYVNDPNTPPLFDLGGGNFFPNTRLLAAGAACDQMDRQAARGDGPLDVEVGVPNPFIKLEQWQVINTTKWEVSDTLTVKNIVSYGELRERSSFALESENFFVPQQFTGILNVGAPFQLITAFSYPGSPYAAGSTLTEELQLQGETADGKLNFVAGGYLEFSRPLGWNTAGSNIFGYCSDPAALDCDTPIGVSFIFNARTKSSFDNHGIFAQGTYNFTDQLALTLGARYTFDKIVGRSEGTRITLVDFGGGAIPLSQTCNDVFTYPGVDIGPITGDGSGDVSKCLVRKVVKSKKPTWLVNLEYKPTPDVMLYAKYSRGYRQGGLNFTNPGLETWGPEKVDAYEVGAKTSFSGAVSGYFNVAAFYNDFTDQQVFGALKPTIYGLSLGISGGAGILNAASSEIKGVEVDAAATFFDSLRLSAGYAYLDTKIKDLIPPDLSGTLVWDSFQPYSKVGGAQTYAPKHRLTLTGSYTLPLDDSIGEISFGATYTHTASQVSNELSPIGIVPANDLLNLNLDWQRVLGSDFDLAFFAANVTNEKYVVGVTGGYDDYNYGLDAKQYGAPRMYGVRLKYNFGQ